MRDTSWVKASMSFSNGNCVEVGRLPDGQVAVRNSRFPGVELPPFTREEWLAFTAGVRAGEFDLDGLDHLAQPASRWT